MNLRITNDSVKNADEPICPASLGSYPSAGDSMQSSSDDLDSRRLAIVGMFRSQDHRSSGFGERIDGRAMAPLGFGEQSREFRLDPERLERGLPALCTHDTRDRCKPGVCDGISSARNRRSLISVGAPRFSNGSSRSSPTILDDSGQVNGRRPESTIAAEFSGVPRC